VRLENLNITKVSFPAAPQKAADLLRALNQHIPTGVKTVPLVQFEASLAALQVTAKTAVVPVQNDPPLIIFSERPALLVRVDGPPVLRQVPNSALMRAINTRALILLDTASGQYYLQASGRWLEAPAVEGRPVAGSRLRPSRDRGRPRLDLRRPSTRPSRRQPRAGSSICWTAPHRPPAPRPQSSSARCPPS
jgi:hypothetical protein